MELVGAVLRTVFQIVTDTYIDTLANLEGIVQSPVLNVLGSAVIQFVFFKPRRIFVVKETPASAFSKSEDVGLFAVGGIFDVQQVTKVECPEIRDNLFKVTAEFTSVRKLVG